MIELTEKQKWEICQNIEKPLRKAMLPLCELMNGYLESGQKLEFIAAYESVLGVLFGMLKGAAIAERAHRSGVLN